MFCGFCGSKTGSPPYDLSVLSPDGRFSYKECGHEGEEQINKKGFAEVEAFREMVQLQLESLNNLERYFKEKRTKLVLEFQGFIENYSLSLEKDKKIAESFDANFEKLASIRIDPSLSKKIQPNLQNYFVKGDLEAWVSRCLDNLQKLQKRVVSIQDLIQSDIERYYQAELMKISNTTIPDASRIEIFDSTFQMLSAEIAQNRGADPAKTEKKIGYLKTFYVDMHRRHSVYIETVRTSVEKALKRMEEKTQANEEMLNALMSDFKKDFKFIELFDDFEETFEKCLEELKLRSKYKALVRNILNCLNVLAQNENTRRLGFLKKYSARIPGQIFPQISGAVKLFKLDAILDSIDDELADQESIQLADKRFAEVQEVILSI